MGNHEQPVRPTRYAELGFQKQSPILWRIIDKQTGRAIGPQYRTLAELVGDLDRLAKIYGAKA